MATAPTPSAGKRKALKLTVHGIEYVLHFSDLNPVDAVDVRKATGIPLSALILDEQPDLDSIGVLYWLARRKGGDRKVTFVDAASEITYDAVFAGAVSIAEVTDEEEGEADPEA